MVLGALLTLRELPMILVSRKRSQTMKMKSAGAARGAGAVRNPDGVRVAAAAKYGWPTFQM